jgi:AraC-like DNA-binding protein
MSTDKAQPNILAGIYSSLDLPVGSNELADQAGYSRAQFYRRVKEMSSISPLSVRRRLLLERAAYRLTGSRQSVTEVAFDAGYESLEGFCRGFQQAYGVSPRRFRRLGPSDYKLDAAHPIHFAPVDEVLDPRQGEPSMKLLERLIDHHCWSMHRVMDRMGALDPDLLDHKLASPNPFPWRCEPETIGTVLRANIGFAEPWLASINGEKISCEDTTWSGKHDRLSQNCTALKRMLESIEKEGRWDLTFIDAYCEPPEVFSYLGVVSHLVTFNAYRRVLLLNELKRLGVTDLGFGDPIEYDPHRMAQAAK